MTTLEDLTLHTDVWPGEDVEQSLGDAMVTMVPADEQERPVLPPRRVRPYDRGGQRVAEGKWNPVGAKVTVSTCRITPDDGETQVFEMTVTSLCSQDALVIVCGI